MQVITRSENQNIFLFNTGITVSIINGVGELGVCVSIEVGACTRVLSLGTSTTLIKIAMYSLQINKLI